MEKFGHVKNGRIITYRNRGVEISRGIGFIEFDSPETVKKAIEAGKITIDQRDVIIKPSYPKRPRITSFIGGLPNEITEDEIKSVLSPSKISKVIFKVNRKTNAKYAFVTFEDPAELTKTINLSKEQRGIEFKGKKCKVVYSRSFGRKYKKIFKHGKIAPKPKSE